MNTAMSTAPVRATPADMSTATPSASVKAILAASSSPPATSAGSMDATRDADDGEGQELKELLKRRKDLVDQRVQERNRLEKGLSGEARRSTERHIEWLDEGIARMDEEYRKALRESAKLSETAALYRSVPGVGEETAASLVAYLPELGKCEGKALTALVGPAPWSRDSSGQRGHRSIRGGRGAVRRVLHLAVLSAIRHNEELGRYYRGLRKRGKAGKVALVAVMGKVLLLLNAVPLRATAFSNNPPPPRWLDSQHRYSRAGGNQDARRRRAHAQPAHTATRGDWSAGASYPFSLEGRRLG